MSEEPQEAGEIDHDRESRLRERFASDSEVATAFRTQLAEEVKNAKLQWVALDHERRSLRAHELILIGPGRNIRSTAYQFRDQTGKPVNMKASGLNSVRARLAEIEHNTQQLELTIDEGEARLAELPEPEPPKKSRKAAAEPA